MKLTILFTLLLSYNLNSQCVVDVYPRNEFDPCGANLTIDSNVIALSPLPFEMTYIIEFKSPSLIKTVLLDRIVQDISISAFISGEWVSFLKWDDQTFCIDEKVRYLMIRYKEDCDKVYLLIE